MIIWGTLKHKQMKLAALEAEREVFERYDKQWALIGHIGLYTHAIASLSRQIEILRAKIKDQMGEVE